jgi:hypothetical protein
MPTLEFKTIAFSEGQGAIDYKEVIRLAIKNPEPQTGQDGRPIPGSFDFDQLFYALKLVDKVDAANGRLELTEEEAKYVVGRVRKMSWFTADRAIGEFLRDVTALDPSAQLPELFAADSDSLQ